MKIGKKMLAVVEDGLGGISPKFLKIYIIESGLFKLNIMGVENSNNIESSNTVYFSVGFFKRKKFVKTLTKHHMIELYKNCYVNAQYFYKFDTSIANESANDDYLHTVNLYGRHGELISSNLTEDQYTKFMDKFKRVRPDLFFIYENELMRKKGLA